jgi:hypothetical protein
MVEGMAHGRWVPANIMAHFMGGITMQGKEEEAQHPGKLISMLGPNYY